MGKSTATSSPEEQEHHPGSAAPAASRTGDPHLSDAAPERRPRLGIPGRLVDDPGLRRRQPPHIRTGRWLCLPVPPAISAWTTRRHRPHTGRHAARTKSGAGGRRAPGGDRGGTGGGRFQASLRRRGKGLGFGARVGGRPHQAGQGDAEGGQGGEHRPPEAHPKRARCRAGRASAGGGVSVAIFESAGGPRRASGGRRHEKYFS